MVDAPSAYNAILGRGRLNAIEALVSTSHLMMKFPTERGVGVEKGQQQVARDCYLVALKGKGGHVVQMEGGEKKEIYPFLVLCRAKASNANVSSFQV